MSLLCTKKQEKFYCKNYGPISLLSNLSKVFERAVYNILYSYLITNDLLNPKNAGFQQGDSTINQLLNITDKLSETLDRGKEARMIFLDAAKAFDRIWHEGVLFKLEQLGVDKVFVNWFASYLRNRQQRVVINGSMSSLLTLQAGVPQSSILGPLLFLVYINDITDNIQTDINLFADDTSLLEIVNDPVSSAQRLNDDLSRLSDWASQWLVTFNPAKSVVINFSLKRKPIDHPVLYLNNSPLLQVKSHTHLGITLTSGLSWSKHVQNIVSKASQRVNIMKRFKYIMGRNSLIHLYKTVVLPIMEYGCILFDNCSKADQDLLESVQLSAARVCTGALQNTSKIKLLDELGWATLAVRRKYFKLVMFF